MQSTTDTKWMANGLCAEKPPALFFPSDGVGVEKAKRICNECDVQSTCLEYALTNRIDHGVWGGTSERQRRRIVRARAAGTNVALYRRSGDATGGDQPDSDRTSVTA